MEQNNCNKKKKKWQQISEYERYKIEAFLEAGKTRREIAGILKRSLSTIQREIKQGLVEQAHVNLSSKREEPLYKKELVYKADYAQLRHKENSSGKGRCYKIAYDYELVEYIEQKIGKERWSPDAVIGEIRNKKLPFKETICTKTLYNYIHGGLFLGISDKDLLCKGKNKRRKHNKIKRSISLNNLSGMSIEERSQEINNRERKGDFEGDLVIGSKKKKGAVLTLVDRQSRISFYEKLPDKKQVSVEAGIKRIANRISKEYNEKIKTITFDNGSEFLNAEAIKRAAGCEAIYYAHPYSSWERGSNENGNRILRRFIPKGTDIGKIKKKELRRIENWVNNYPRKILDYKSAKEVYMAFG